MISVVVPTCHRNDLLAKCLDALAPGKQSLSYSEYEVIVTDDGSKSTAEQMVKEKYPWARWTQGPRKGPAANRNHGAAQAKGQWLAFTDDDCIPTPDWLASFHRKIQSGRLFEGKTIARTGIPGPFWTSPENLEGGRLWSCNMLIKKNAFEDLGGFDEGFPGPHMEDVDFRVRAERELGSAVFVPDALVDHPARPIGSFQSQAKGHLSSVYYCRKHGVALASVGLSSQELFLSIPRRLKQNLRYGLFQALRYLAFYDVPRAVLLATKLPYYRRLLK